MIISGTLIVGNTPFGILAIALGELYDLDALLPRTVFPQLATVALPTDALINPIDPVIETFALIVQNILIK